MAHIVTQEDIIVMMAVPATASDNHCIACGSEFNAAGDRAQHIWENREDDFQYHGNQADVNYQTKLDVEGSL